MIAALGTAALAATLGTLAVALWRKAKPLPAPEKWQSRYGTLSPERTEIMRRTGR